VPGWIVAAVDGFGYDPGGEGCVSQAKQTVGARIRQRRNELGWTQDVLAEKAGISKGFLSDLENGKRSVGADTLLDIGRVLGLSLDYLMTGRASETPPAEVPIPASLARFAGEEGLSFRQTLMLLEMQQQIVAHRSAHKKAGLGAVDWRKFYEAVKEFLEDG
jgi:transcriptional regulator with XRE-family HTH domain